MFVAAFPTGPSVCLGGGGGGGGGHKHKLWNFHRYLLVYIIICGTVTNNDDVEFVMGIFLCSGLPCTW